MFNYAIENCIYKVQLRYYDIRYYVIRISFGVKQSIIIRNFIPRETVIIEKVIRHGTQKPKFDFRFGMALRNQNSTSGLAGRARGKF
jgi:hypothetical protein